MQCRDTQTCVRGNLLTHSGGEKLQLEGLELLYLWQKQKHENAMK